MEKSAANEKLSQRVKSLSEIEEQCQAEEEALRESSEKYQSLLDLSPDSVVILQDGQYQFVSSVFTRQFGYTQEDVSNGLSFFQLVQEKDHEIVRRRHEDRLAGKKLPKTFRIDLISKDGLIIPCETSAALIQFNGQPADLVLIRDISERIAAEGALQDSEETMRVLINSTHDLALLVDIDGKVLTVNTKAAERYGQSPEELTGKNIYTLMPPKSVALRKRMAHEVIRTKKPVHYSEESAGKFFDCNLFPILDHAGNVQSFTVFVRDVTDRRQYEKALQSVREELEQRVKERTRELEEKTRNIEEVNTALKVLLKRLDEDKKALEDKVLINVRQLISPNLEKLKKSKLSHRQKRLLGVLESDLKKIVSPFARNISTSFMKLTPTEIQVANLVREGKTSKEIAYLLNLSIKTIEFHRENIRTKIGIKNKKINLRTFLLSSQ